MEEYFVTNLESTLPHFQYTNEQVSSTCNSGGIFRIFKTKVYFVNFQEDIHYHRSWYYHCFNFPGHNESSETIASAQDSALFGSHELITREWHWSSHLADALCIARSVVGSRKNGQKSHPNLFIFGIPSAYLEKQISYNHSNSLTRMIIFVALYWYFAFSFQRLVLSQKRI